MIRIEYIKPHDLVRIMSVLFSSRCYKSFTMKFVVTLGLLAVAIVTEAGVSMNNPFFCYMTDPIRSMTNMHSGVTSYQAIRRFNFTTVNPYISSKV